MHIGQTEVTWSMLLWTKHMLVVGEEEGSENIEMGVSIRNEVMTGGWGDVLTVFPYNCCPHRTGHRRR